MANEITPAQISSTPRSATYTLPSLSNNTFAGRIRPCTTPCRCAEATPAATVSNIRTASSGVKAGRRDAFGEAAAGHQTTDHDSAVGLSPVVEQWNDVWVLDTRDSLRCGLEATDELRMADHSRAEDPHGDLATNRRLVGPVHVAELARADQRTELVTRHRPVTAGGHGGRQSIDQQVGEVLRAPSPTS